LGGHSATVPFAYFACSAPHPPCLQRAHYKVALSFKTIYTKTHTHTHTHTHASLKSGPKGPGRAPVHASEIRRFSHDVSAYTENSCFWNPVRDPDPKAKFGFYLKFGVPWRQTRVYRVLARAHAHPYWGPRYRTQAEPRSGTVSVRNFCPKQGFVETDQDPVNAGLGAKDPQLADKS
jgi:hypothetical protein